MKINKLYNTESCQRKADQHWDLAGLAHADRDLKDAERHTKLARLWSSRAREGNYSTPR